MSASSSLFMVVVLASLMMSANSNECTNLALKCCWGNVQLGIWKRRQCDEPGPAFCIKFNCTMKDYAIQSISMGGCQYNSSFCDPGFNIESNLSECDVQCCHDDFCNGKFNIILGSPSGVIGLHTSFGIFCIVFAVLIAAIFSVDLHI